MTSKSRIARLRSELAVIDSDYSFVLPVNDQDVEYAQIVMGLALVSDKELSPDAYRQSLQGWENIPWFLNKTRNDLSKYIKFLSSIPLDADQDISDLPQQLLSLLESLYQFRFLKLQAELLDKDELVMKGLLEVIRRFYSVYNRPEFRDKHTFYNNSALLSSMIVVISLCKEVLRDANTTIVNLFDLTI